MGRGASWAAFPRRAWERSSKLAPTVIDRSHALRGNASRDALRHAMGRGASWAAFPRRAWERSSKLAPTVIGHCCGATNTLACICSCPPPRRMPRTGQASR
ncbi:hypothetical protein C7A10_13635 [Pseudomonas fluorescens]|uniref:DUF1534 domain-containing protein n=1 Tax=Pseudomonas fluorescens TaxID=294 RepID=A0A2T0IAU6_PSEFL|nr:hypothetical protein C7A10_13635 [Pseudomonas fluorescens]